MGFRSLRRDIEHIRSESLHVCTLCRCVLLFFFDLEDRVWAFEKTLLFLGSRGSLSPVVTLAMEACGEVRFPEARTASLTVMRGILCHTSCPWSQSARCVGFGMETEGGGGERGGWSCPLIPRDSFFTGTHWGNSSVCVPPVPHSSLAKLQPGSKQSLPLFSVPENQKMWFKTRSWRENRVTGSGCSLVLWVDGELEVNLQVPNFQIPEPVQRTGLFACLC